MSDMDRVVRRMEHIREDLEECESAAERVRLQAEYRSLSVILNGHAASKSGRAKGPVRAPTPAKPNGMP